MDQSLLCCAVDVAVLHSFALLVVVVVVGVVVVGIDFEIHYCDDDVVSSIDYDSSHFEVDDALFVGLDVDDFVDCAVAVFDTAVVLVAVAVAVFVVVVVVVVVAAQNSVFEWMALAIVGMRMAEGAFGRDMVASIS